MRLTVGVVGLVLMSFAHVAAEELGWPREVETKKGLVTMYQPQIEEFDGDTIQGRAAVSVLATESEAGPVFGAFWFEARVDTDREARLVTLRDFRIPNVRFPEATEEEREQLARLLEVEVPTWDVAMSLDRLITDLDDGESNRSTPGLKHDPPRILLSTKPAVLIVIDGEPILQKLEQMKSADVEQVVNTPFPMFRDVQTNTFFLSGGGSLWYEGPSATGPFAVSSNVPLHIAATVTDTTTVDPTEESPEVIVATEPTELIVSAGEPSWSPVEGMDLLYLDNSDSDVFLELASQTYYVVLAGRWYRAQAVDSNLDWEHVPNDDLPAPFSAIDEESTNGGVLVYVAGTEQAREAALDNQIPQTSAIERSSDTAVKVDYDGEPKFEKVEDTPGVLYAVNTQSSVFRVAEFYYLCHQGVWYEAKSSAGPWKVSSVVPQVIYDIPASNPHHNVTYVHVYHSTPEVVYVGYTAGYMNSYYYGGCVVYGTGWYYRPWYGHYYYPRPSTWGFRVSYSPYYGWGVGLTWSNGPFSISIGRGGAWFGVGGYRPYPRPYVGRGYHKTNININRNITINNPGGNRPGGGTRPSTGGPVTADRPGRNNLYNRPENRDRNAAQPGVSDRSRPSNATNRANNVMTDRDGNVYRREDGGDWQRRDNGQWKNADNLDRSSGGRPSVGSQPSQRAGAGGGGASARPSNPSASTGSRPSAGDRSRGSSSAARPQLERDHRARQRGNQRAGGYSRSQSGGASRSRGGRGRR